MIVKYFEEKLLWAACLLVIVIITIFFLKKFKFKQGSDFDSFYHNSRFYCLAFIIAGLVLAFIISVFTQKDHF